MIILSSGKEVLRNFSMLVSEVSLGESKNKYPTIPAIEVTIPHFSVLMKLLKNYTVM